jgi:hypothetical protein
MAKRGRKAKVGGSKKRAGKRIYKRKSTKGKKK